MKRDMLLAGLAIGCSLSAVINAIVKAVGS